jgi:hypothetical protein
MSKIVRIFSLASVVVEILTILDFALNKSCKTYLGPMLPPGVNFTNILWQLLRQNPFAKKLQTQIVST